jgi:hypothetical protein
MMKTATAAVASDRAGPLRKAQRVIASDGQTIKPNEYLLVISQTNEYQLVMGEYRKSISTWINPQKYLNASLRVGGWVSKGLLVACTDEAIANSATASYKSFCSVLYYRHFVTFVFYRYLSYH